MSFCHIPILFFPFKKLLFGNNYAKVFSLDTHNIWVEQMTNYSNEETSYMNVQTKFGRCDSYNVFVDAFHPVDHKSLFQSNPTKVKCHISNVITRYDFPISVPSQVIVGRTLAKKQMLMSVATKIAIQLNCKLGGDVWSVEIPVSSSSWCQLMDIMSSCSIIEYQHII